MNEVETKVLDVEPLEIAKAMVKLGAKKLQKVRLKVKWFRKIGWGEGDDEWFLRIRSYDDKKYEVTWKANSKVLGISRKHKEINFLTDFPYEVADLFLEIGLEEYAFQEKDRTSWQLNGWRFDLDQYPGMPAYLEVEGKSDKHIKKALKLLGLLKNETSAEGERKLIQNKYGLDWYEMRF